MIKMQMFPLDVCLLPGERLPLHIFENRYKELIQSCLNAGETFGIPFGLDEETRQIGAEVRVKKVLNTNEDGSLDIIVESVGSFNILDYRPEMDHRSCDTALVEEVEIEQLISRNSGLLSLYLDFRKEYFKVDELKLSFEDQNLIIMARSCRSFKKSEDSFFTKRHQDQGGHPRSSVGVLAFHHGARQTKGI